MASSNGRVRVIEVCQLSPPSDSPEAATELSLPLTFFDTFWIKFHPVDRIFFYELRDLNSAFFSSVILPEFKNSLSVALLHFLPLAGKLTWPSHADQPFILYTPKGAVSLTVAESDADFYGLSEDKIREAVESHPYVPKLDVSETQAATIAFQITLFPDKGFCIGVSSHHAVLDGKTVTMFMKAWAHLCKQRVKHNNTNPSLSPELTPILDRTLIQDPDGIGMEYLNNWSDLMSMAGLDHNPRSLKLLPASDVNLARGTFNLSREDVKELRQKVLSLQSKLDNDTEEAHQNQSSSVRLSTFVLTYAFIATKIVQAKRLEINKKVLLGFTADCRARLDPPIPDNYFGNCVSPHMAEAEVEAIMAENGLALAAEKLSETIKGLEKGGALKDAKHKLATFKTVNPASTIVIGVAGSPRFEVYATDFGWGRPKKVEVTSIDRNESISMAESRDGSGGVEIEVVLKKPEMEIFYSLFVNGLKDL